MDTLLAVLALCNVLALLTVFAPRSFPDNMLPWFVFGFALLATELAWFWLPLQAVLALICVAGGALDSTLGWIGLIVLLLSWPGLLHNLRLGLQSGATVEEALTEALGSDYRSRIPATAAARLRGAVGFRDWCRPFRMARPDVEVIRNIAYANGGIRQRLDIYRPRVIPPQGCPVVLQIHGGGWIIGNKEEQALPLMYQLAASGWICVAANYRLSPSVGFPTHLHDCKAALAWIRTHGREYGMDPSFVAVTGGSAGGHLCALMGLTANRDENRERWELASPVSQVHPDAPPFMVLHGSCDSLAPVADARLFVQRLREVAREPVAYVEFTGAEHAFEIMHSPRAEQAVDGVQRFIEWVRATRT